MSELDQLLRWETSGGTWRVTGRAPLVVALCRCDGGEEVDRLTLDEPAALAYVDGRETSEDPGPELAD